MEHHLDPLYEAFERLNKAKDKGDQDLVNEIEKEMDTLRKKAVEESKKKGSLNFFKTINSTKKN
jgi:hypothetical protein